MNILKKIYKKVFKLPSRFKGNKYKFFNSIINFFKPVGYILLMMSLVTLLFFMIFRSLPETKFETLPQDIHLQKSFNTVYDIAENINEENKVSYDEYMNISMRKIYKTRGDDFIKKIMKEKKFFLLKNGMEFDIEESNYYIVEDDNMSKEIITNISGRISYLKINYKNKNGKEFLKKEIGENYLKKEEYNLSRFAVDVNKKYYLMTTYGKANDTEVFEIKITDNCYLQCTIENYPKDLALFKYYYEDAQDYSYYSQLGEENFKYTYSKENNLIMEYNNNLLGSLTKNKIEFADKSIELNLALKNILTDSEEKMQHSLNMFIYSLLFLLFLMFLQKKFNKREEKLTIKILAIENKSNKINKEQKKTKILSI
jgi:hypothetical protein